MKKKKKPAYVAPLDAPIVTPIVEPVYYEQQPQMMPYQRPQQPRPMPAPVYAQPRPQPAPFQSQPEQSPSTYKFPDNNYASEYDDSFVNSNKGAWFSEENYEGTGTENASIIAAPEFDITNDTYETFETAEGWLGGLSEGGGWADLFTNVGAELLATQKAKREKKTERARQAQYQALDRPGMSTTNFSLEKMMLPLAIAGAGIFLLMRKKRR